MKYQAFESSLITEICVQLATRELNNILNNDLTPLVELPITPPEAKTLKYRSLSLACCCGNDAWEQYMSDSTDIDHIRCTRCGRRPTRDNIQPGDTQ
jgi:hypothetical protein